MRGAAGLFTIALCASLGCGEPSVDLHLVREADADVGGEPVEPTPCDDCLERTWSLPGGEPIRLRVERDPFLSVSRKGIASSEIVHSKWLYRPFCDLFQLELRMQEPWKPAAETRPVLALVEGEPVALARDLLNGELLRIPFYERRSAVAVARKLELSTAIRVVDDSWRAESRAQIEAILDEVAVDPMLADEVDRKFGVHPRDLEREELDAVFCP